MLTDPVADTDPVFCELAALATASSGSLVVVCAAETAHATTTLALTDTGTLALTPRACGTSPSWARRTSVQSKVMTMATPKTSRSAECFARRSKRTSRPFPTSAPSNTFSVWPAGPQ